MIRPESLAGHGPSHRSDAQEMITAGLHPEEVVLLRPADAQEEWSTIEIKLHQEVVADRVLPIESDVPEEGSA